MTSTAHRTGSKKSTIKGTVRILSQQEELPLLRDHFCGSTPPAVMTASMASWTTASSNVTPKNAPTTARSSSVISKMAWCVALPNCIRRSSRRTRCRRSPSAWKPRTAQGRRQHPVQEADRGSTAKGYTSLRITTGAQNQAMRALANKFGAHLTFRHGKSTGSIDLKQQPLSPSPALRSPTTIDAARAIDQSSIARTGG